MDLIKVEKGKIFTDSLKFSEKLDINHRDILRDIRNLVATNNAIRNEFLETNWTNTQNRTYPKFEMTKKGFMSLIMNTNVTPAKKKLLYEVQNEFINAFEKMEKTFTMLSEATKKSVKNMGVGDNETKKNNTCRLRKNGFRRADV